MKAEVESGRLRLSHRGRRRRLHPVWLRERCPCPECRDAGTGQRLLDGTEIPLDLAVRAAGVEDDGALAVAFSDGHASRFARTEAEAWLAPRRGGLLPEGVETWDATLAPLPEADYAAAAAGPAALHRLLAALARFGFVRVRGVPAEADALDGFARLIGPIRETNWGRIADVKAIPRAYDLTMTPRALEPHADNPYREPVPGYVLLHCLANSAEGGETTLTDGFRAALELRARAPEAFRTLTRVRPRFRYADAETVLESEGPLIETDAAGGLYRVRFSNRTDEVAALPPARLEAYYRARRAFAELVADPALQLRFKLAPGELLAMDNHRLLHGRTAYVPGTGERHLRQAYMDRDAVAGRRKALARRLGGAAPNAASVA